jgi:serine/threonine protein kinase
MVKANNRQTTGSIFASKLEGREFGKYRAETLISRHEFRQTITLLAVNKETNQRVVLKAFGSFSVKSQKEHEKEIAAFKKLEGRHGVLLPLETFEYEGDYFIVTEYKNGGDLRGWLETKPKINEILDVFARIADSIDYVHENKIIHRDIKPENVVYEALDGRITPYLMDFGISVTLSGATSSFETEHTFGTIEYMAPELFSNRDKKTKAVDIYAFGLMLYEALEGRHPLLGNTQQETMSQILSGDVPLPEKTIKRLGGNAGFMLVKALSKDPDNRPGTATEIVTQVGSQYRKYVGKTYGKYITEECLGQGLYGVTCKAYELKKNKKVTIKLLTSSQSQKPDIGDLKRLEHNKGIAPIIDAGCENGTPYLVSEYVTGDNLRHVFSPQGMEVQDILKILKPLSATLDYLHGKGIIHCDLKPENILLQKHKIDGGLQPFVNDYGVSKIAEVADVLNANGNIPLGNLNYLAPEILEGREASPAADVYSLGVIIYEAIEGKTPFDAKSLPALIRQKLEGNVPVPEHLLKSGGIRAARVLLKALNVRPEKRQRSASELVSQLEDAINNRAFFDKGIFVELWVKSRKFVFDFKKSPYAFWVSGLLLVLFFGWIFSFIPAYLMTSPTSTPTPTYTPAASPTITATPTVTTTPTPSPVV